MRSGTRSGFGTGAAAAGDPPRPAEAGIRSGGTDRIVALAALVDSLSAQIDAIEDGPRAAPPPAAAERPRDERLASLGRKIAARGDDRLDGIEQRLAAIAEQIAGRDRPAPPRALTPAATFGDLQASIAEIAARQRLIDEEGGQLAPVDSIAIEDAIRALRGDIAALGRRIEPLKAEDIGRIVRAELGAQPPASGIEALRAELDDIRQAIELSARETTLASVEAGYGHVIERLDDIVRRVPERERIDALALEIARIAEHFERTPPREIGGELDDIRNAIASFTSTGHDRDIHAEFATLRQAIEQIDAATPAAFSRLEREIGSLREDVGSLQRSDPSELLHRLERQMAEIGAAVGDGGGVDPQAFSRLEERLDALAGRFDAITDIPNLKSLASGEAIDSLKAEIAALRGEIAGQEPLRLEAIENQLSGLMQRIDGIAAGGDGAQLGALEAEVAALADKLASAGPDAEALGKVEQNLDKLQRLLGSTRHESIEAARDAARAALAEFAASRGLGPDDDVIRALRDDLGTLQAAAHRSDQQNRDTLEAVHDTLAKVVDRIAELEHRDVPTNRSHPRHGETAPFADTPEDHRPLAPGSGKPDLGGSRDAAAAPADPSRTGDRKADFIAAARRAAQAAQAETTRIQQAEAAARDARPGPLSRIGQALRSRRRPLVLAMAAVLLAIGAAEYGPHLGSRVLDAANPFAAQFDPTVTASVKAAPAKRLREAAGNPVRQATANSVREATANPPPAEGATADAAKPSLVAPATGGDLAFQPADPIAGYLAANPAPDTSAFNPPEPAPTLDLTLVQTAAAKGDAIAAFEMAKHLAEGDGIQTDMKLAASWYEKAAKAGLPLAQFRIGSLYERGDGVKRDTVAAQKWYEKASMAGNAQATHNLAVMLSEGANDKPDYTRALALFRMAAQFGIADSQYNLGVLYARGLGADVDLIQSYVWFSLAAAQGDVDAGGRRDDVAKAMKVDDLARARATVDAFEPQPLDPAANREPKPKAEWMQTASVKGTDIGASG